MYNLGSNFSNNLIQLNIQFKNIIQEKNIVSALLFLPFIFSLSIEHWLSTWFGLLLLTALIRVKNFSFDWIKDDKETKILLWLGLAMFISTLISNTISGWTHSNVVRLEVDSKQFFSLFILIYLFHFKDCYHWFFRALPIAAIVLFLTIALSGFSDRNNEVGAYSYIIFGNLSALLFFMILLSKDKMNYQSKYLTNILWGLGLIGSFVTMFYAGSRNGWLSFGILSLFILMFYPIKNNKIMKASILTVLLVFIGILYQGNFFDKTINEFNHYQTQTKNNFDLDDQSSAGLRLRQISAGFKAWQNKPLLGYGAGNTIMGFEDEVKKGTISKLLLQTNTHLHNGYIMTLVDKGLIGFIFKYGFLLFILWTFFKFRKHDTNLAFLGMIFILAHLSFSLTETPFIRNNHTAIFYLGFIVLWHSMRKIDE